MKQCPCPMPPGGVVTCDDDQVAVCRVIGGVPHGECVTPPSEHRAFFEKTGDPDRLYSWALEVITGHPRRNITQQDRDTLRSGRYQDVVTGEEVSFALPEYFFATVQQRSSY